MLSDLLRNLIRGLGSPRKARAKNELSSNLYANSRRFWSVVGTSSATVGWMCTARETTVYCSGPAILVVGSMPSAIRTGLKNAIPRP